MDIRESDQATYICAGKNSQGGSEQEIAVRVEGKAQNIILCLSNVCDLSLSSKGHLVLSILTTSLLGFIDNSILNVLINNVVNTL